MSVDSSSAPQPAAADRAAIILAEVEALRDDLRLRRGRPVELDSDLSADLGLDSLALVELEDRLEQRFGVRFPDETLAEASTPREWLQALERGGWAAHPVAPPPVRPVASGTELGAREWPRSAQTLTEALAWHVEQHPERITIRLLGAHGEETGALSYRQLATEAHKVADALLELGLERSDRVGIMLGTERAYFTTFLGVLFAGGVPVPLYPPARQAVLQEHLARQSRLLENAGATALVTLPEAKVAARLVRMAVPSLRLVLTPDAIVAGAGGVGREAAPPSGDDLAVIQYTSGSTGDPKGVVLTHAQLLADVAAMGQAADVTTADAFVSWLPLYHDMGLIGAWLAPMVLGLPLIVQSPLSFLARPATWLRAISQYRGTLSAAPNFAFALCVERIGDDELAGIDLSSWRIAFNGSEPVGMAVIDRFVDRFEPFGFRRQTMCPAYGLAEVGLGVTFSPPERGPLVDVVDRHALERTGRAVPLAEPGAPSEAVVGCGFPLPGYEIRIVDPGGHELPDRWEGRLECRGPSAATEYFHNEEATRALWRHGWLDTGDLGYVADGELFVTGRAKDVIVRAGRKLHPEELETAVGELPGVRRDGVAAFSVADPQRGTERFVVVVETALAEPAERSALHDEVVRVAIELLGSSPDEVVLVAPGSVPTTASGKVRRGATRDAYQAGTLGQRPASARVQLARFAFSSLRSAAPHLFGRVGGWLYAAYAWSLAVAVGLPTWLVLQLPMPLSARWRFTRAAGRALQAASGITVEVVGDLPPADERVLVVANHPSFLDGLVLVLASKEPLVLVASTDLEKQPVVGSLLRRLGCVFTTRGEAARTEAAVAALGDVVRAGGRLAIFPEGSIARAPGLRPFHLGAFAVAATTGVPVVPVGIAGARDVVRAGTYLPRRGRILVTVGSPVAPSGTDLPAQVELRDAVRQAILELSGERDIA